MTYLAMALVETLREHAVDVPHQQRQIGQPRLQHEVVVIAHQSPAQSARIKALQPSAQYIQQSPPINVIHKDRLPPIPARGHVIDGAGEFNAKRSCHRGR